VDDGSARPAFSLDKYVPTSRPGSRAPHVWLRDGRSLYDLFGRDFTLLRLGHVPVASDALVDAAQKRGVPVKALEIAEPEVVAAYENYPLILIRPDQHIAWRGHSVPADAIAMIDRIRGA
jgi:hypothetical protein